jgi:hypothetical protein
VCRTFKFLILNVLIPLAFKELISVREYFEMIRIGNIYYCLYMSGLRGEFSLTGTLSGHSFYAKQQYTKRAENKERM